MYAPEIVRGAGAVDFKTQVELLRPPVRQMSMAKYLGLYAALTLRENGFAHYFCTLL